MPCASFSEFSLRSACEALRKAFVYGWWSWWPSATNSTIHTQRSEPPQAARRSEELPYIFTLFIVFTYDTYYMRVEYFALL